MKLISKIGLLCAVVTVISSSCNSEKYTLEYKLAKGDVFEQSVSMDMSIIQSVGGDDTKMINLMSIETNYEVVDVKDDVYTMAFQYDSIKLETDMGIMRLFLNSNTSETIATVDNLSPMLKTMIGPRLELEMDKYGKVHSVGGYDVMLEDMMRSLDHKISMSNKEAMVDHIGQQLSEETLKSIFEQTSSYYPEKPVGQGDSWHRIMNATVGGGIGVSVDLKMTLKGVKDNIAIIEGEGVIETPEGGITQIIEEFKAKINLKGTQHGTIKIDMNTGLPVNVEITQNIEGVTEIPIMSMPMILTSKISMTTQKK
jgi:hypothetical protein